VNYSSEKCCEASPAKTAGEAEDQVQVRSGSTKVTSRSGSSLRNEKLTSENQELGTITKALSCLGLSRHTRTCSDILVGMSEFSHSGTLGFLVRMFCILVLHSHLSALDHQLSAICCSSNTRSTHPGLSNRSSSTALGLDASTLDCTSDSLTL
jgi:hypothetical protein